MTVPDRQTEQAFADFWQDEGDTQIHAIASSVCRDSINQRRLEVREVCKRCFQAGAASENFRRNRGAGT